MNEYNSHLGKCNGYDLVQGCAGGVAGMILASQLSELNKSNILVIHADAARKATSVHKKIHSIFSNGAFGCVVSYEKCNGKLIHTKSLQFKGLSEVVTVKMGHDADAVIEKEKENVLKDPRMYLGLSMNNISALKLMRKAENFFIEFISESEMPDVLVLHQVNPVIIKHLEKVFSKYPVHFVNESSNIGNCGVSTTGIALLSSDIKTEGRKIMLCSFGTGGVITAGMWQF